VVNQIKRTKRIIVISFFLMCALTLALFSWDVTIKIKSDDQANPDETVNTIIILALYTIIGTSLTAATAYLIHQINHRFSSGFDETRKRLVVVLSAFILSFAIKITMTILLKFNIIDVSERLFPILVIIVGLFSENMPLLVIYIYHYNHFRGLGMGDGDSSSGRGTDGRDTGATMVTNSDDSNNSKSEISSSVQRNTLKSSPSTPSSGDVSKCGPVHRRSSN